MAYSNLPLAEKGLNVISGLWVVTRVSGSLYEDGEGTRHRASTVKILEYIYGLGIIFK